jgi:hypothetical protein
MMNGSASTPQRSSRRACWPTSGRTRARHRWRRCTSPIKPVEAAFNEPIIARQIIVADATVEPLADVWATLVLPGSET